MFGWEAGEVFGGRLPLVPIGNEEELKEVFCPNRLLKNPADFHLFCLSKSGEPLECAISGIPFEAAVNDRSAVVFMAWAGPGASGAQPVVKSRRSQAAGPVAASASMGSAIGTAGDESRGRPGESGTGRDAEQSPLILIADHDAEARAALRRILDELGCRSVDCSSADEAVVHVRSASETQVSFALIIIELIMPTGLDGLAAARQMLALDSRARVALASEWPVEGHQQHGLVGAVKKPYEKEEIRGLLSAPRASRVDEVAYTTRPA